MCVCVTWIWLVLLFQSNVADVFHCFFFTRHYSHETNRKQASTPHSFRPEMLFIPPFKQRVGPKPEFRGLSLSSVWHQLKSFPLFPTGRGLRRPLGLPLPFCFQPYKRKAALRCLFFISVFWGQTAFPVENLYTSSLSPTTQIRAVFV